MYVLRIDPFYNTLDGIYSASGVDCQGLLKICLALREGRNKSKKFGLPKMAFEDLDHKSLLVIGIARVCAILDVRGCLLAQCLHPRRDRDSIRTAVVTILDRPEPEIVFDQLSIVSK